MHRMSCLAYNLLASHEGCCMGLGSSMNGKNGCSRCDIVWYKMLTGISSFSSDTWHWWSISWIPMETCSLVWSTELPGFVWQMCGAACSQGRKCPKQTEEQMATPSSWHRGKCENHLRCNHLLWITGVICSNWGHTVVQLVDALRYKPEGCGFNSRWRHQNFSLT